MTDSANEIDRIARHWLQAVPNEMSSEAWQQFKSWLQSDTRHRTAFLRAHSATQDWTQFKLVAAGFLDELDLANHRRGDREGPIVWESFEDWIDADPQHREALRVVQEARDRISEGLTSNLDLNDNEEREVENVLQALHARELKRAAPKRLMVRVLVAIALLVAAAAVRLLSQHGWPVELCAAGHPSLWTKRRLVR